MLYVKGKEREIEYVTMTLVKILLLVKEDEYGIGELEEVLEVVKRAYDRPGTGHFSDRQCVMSGLVTDLVLMNTWLKGE